MTPDLASPLGDLDSGQVALYTHATDSGVLDALPPSAFENLLLVTTNTNLDAIEQTVAAHSGTPSHVGVVPVASSAADYDGPLWTTEPVTPGDLTGVSIRFSTAFAHVRPADGWVVVDGLGVLAMYVSVERLFRFVDSVTTAVRERGAHCVLSTASGVLSDDALARFRALADADVRG